MTELHLVLGVCGTWLVAVVAGCGGGPAVRGSGGDDAGEELVAVADAFWQEYLEVAPTEATRLGIPGYDDRLGDNSPQAGERHQARLGELLARARAVDASRLSRAHRVTRAFLIEEIEGRLAVDACDSELWTVDQLWGPQVYLLSLPVVHTLIDDQRARAYTARLRAMPGYIDQHVANLRTGLARGLVAPRINVERVIDQLDAIAAVPIERDPLVRAADALPGALPPEHRERYERELRALVADGIRPAFQRYREMLAAEVLPRARDQVGVGALSNGAACYRAQIRRHTSRDLAPDDVHQLGLAEVAAVRAEMQQLAERLFPGEPLPDVLERLRSTPEHAFATRDDIEDFARDALTRAQAAVPKVFSRLPRMPCAVQRLQPHLEKDAPMAYYQRPQADGSRSGAYMVNTFDPPARPRYIAEVLAFHEAVPGHHTQIALALELTELHPFQRDLSISAFTEGWALYAERLADELGLYSSELDRLGMLSFAAWRAARLVVDTGIHARGWTRQQAIDYMLANTASSLVDVTNEVDRYIAWPGQALAYRIGHIEIARLRQLAESRLGDGFDLRDFHWQVLRNGAVPLSVLAQEIEAWIAEREAAPDA